MDEQFWHQKWEQNDIGFHMEDINPMLLAYFSKLNLYENSRIFVPLCGKTNDIKWLLSQGHSVVGAELNEQAVQQLFRDHHLTPSVTSIGKMKKYSTENLEVFVGNIFDLTDRMLGLVDAIYDRGALVALPKKMRDQYAEHLIRITDAAPQLLLCFVYDQSEMAGPPFSISKTEVEEQYGDMYLIEELIKKEVEGNLLSLNQVWENVWLLKPST